MNNQSIIDIALIACGSAEAAVEMAILNGISITDLPDQIGVVPAVVDADVVAYFSAKNIQPSTGLVEAAERVVSAVDTLVSDEVQIGSYVRVQEQQTLFDIALQETGSIDAAHAMAVLNGLSITDTITPGTLLQRVGVVDKKIKNYYNTKGIRPATGMPETIQVQEGVFDFTFDFTFD